MKNPFENLRTDTRPILQGKWVNYPALRDFSTRHVFVDGRFHVKVLTGQQDGQWVAGVSIQMPNNGYGFFPSRRWGQFASEKNAMLWALGCALTLKLVAPADKAVKNEIEKLSQFNLFQ